MITSHHNPKLKEIRRLQRRRDERFVAEGEDLLAAADAAGWPALERHRARVHVGPETLAKASRLGSGTRALAVLEGRRLEGAAGPPRGAPRGVPDPRHARTGHR